MTKGASIVPLRGRLTVVPRASDPLPPARTTTGSLAVSLGHSSLQGRRSRNEDFVGAATPEGPELESHGLLLVVADGVGGHANGREAAEGTVRGLLSDYYATPDTWSVAKSLDTVLDASNRWLVSQARKVREYAGMATTLSSVVMRGARWYVAHVGDSRVYLCRAGELAQLTEDHTWEHPELSNVLRRAIGLDNHLTLDHADGELQEGDRFVLLTDGIWATLVDRSIRELIERHPRADECADALALEALRRGSSDNCTALVVNVETVPSGNLRDRLASARRLPLPPRLKPGQVLDGLRVEEVIHESRVTLLYRVTRAAEPAQTGAAATPPETLVMKTLRPDAGDDEAVSALAHEEWLARRVVSPGFPQVLSHPGRAHLYYLMTWHEGATLDTLLGRGHRFACHEVAEIGIRLLKGVATLHRMGIRHRDVKPANLHLDSQGQLRILDMGVAASDGQHFREINNPGTPSYMAPELFAGHTASVSTDLYACGVTLYELLTRRYPYGEVEPFQTPRFGSPAPPTRFRTDTPAWLEAILLKAVAREREDRFETADEFLLALERGAHRPLANPGRKPLITRHPSLALKAIALASVLANVVLIYLLFGR